VREGACVDCHRGDAAASRKELAHHRLLTGGAAAHSLASGRVVKTGETLVSRAACRRCHRVGASGNSVAAELDGIVWHREQHAPIASIVTPVDNMPVFGFDRAQAEALIAFLLSHHVARTAADTYRVRFVTTGGDVRTPR
jgi:mono/diheme cytochrome c family protein